MRVEFIILQKSRVTKECVIYILVNYSVLGFLCRFKVLIVKSLNNENECDCNLEAFLHFREKIILKVFYSIAYLKQKILPTSYFNKLIVYNCMKYLESKI